MSSLQTVCSPGTPLWHDSIAICFSCLFMQITQALLKAQHGLSLPLEPAHWALPIGLRLAPSACPLGIAHWLETCPFSLPLQLAHVQCACLKHADIPLARLHALQLFECSDKSRRCHKHLCTSMPACYHIYSCRTHSSFPVNRQDSVSGSCKSYSNNKCLSVQPALHNNT